MSDVEKISVSLARDVVVWLRERAAELGTSVSALLSEAAIRERQRAARIEYAEEVGLPKASGVEIAAVLAEIRGQPVASFKAKRVRRGRAAGAPKRRRRPA